MTLARPLSANRRNSRAVAELTTLFDTLRPDDLGVAGNVNELLTDYGAQMFPTKWLATSVDHDRLIADEVFKNTRCDVNVRMNQLGTDLSSVWRRAFRYRAEREATANALRVREGTSIDSASRCSDGGWTFDGTTLRFSREIATAPPDRPMPLVLQVNPTASDALTAD